jgi:hypothetical protein
MMQEKILVRNFLKNATWKQEGSNQEEMGRRDVNWTDMAQDQTIFNGEL